MFKISMPRVRVHTLEHNVRQGQCLVTGQVEGRMLKLTSQLDHVHWPTARISTLLIHEQLKMSTVSQLQSIYYTLPIIRSQLQKAISPTPRILLDHLCSSLTHSIRHHLRMSIVQARDRRYIRDAQIPHPTHAQPRVEHSIRVRVLAHGAGAGRVVACIYG
jgi:hypothetical protein